MLMLQLSVVVPFKWNHWNTLSDIATDSIYPIIIYCTSTIPPWAALWNTGTFSNSSSSCYLLLHLVSHSVILHISQNTSYLVHGVTVADSQPSQTQPEFTGTLSIFNVILYLRCELWFDGCCSSLLILLSLAIDSTICQYCLILTILDICCCNNS